MLWISTRAGWPSEGRFGSAFIKKPPGPNLAQIWGTENFSGVEGLKGAEMGRKDKIRTGYYVLQLSKLVDVFTQFNNLEVLVENALSFNLAELCKKINQFLIAPKSQIWRFAITTKLDHRTLKSSYFFQCRGFDCLYQTHFCDLCTNVLTHLQRANDTYQQTLEKLFQRSVSYL